MRAGACIIDLRLDHVGEMPIGHTLQPPTGEHVVRFNLNLGRDGWSRVCEPGFAAGGNPFEGRLDLS